MTDMIEYHFDELPIHTTDDSGSPLTALFTGSATIIANVDRGTFEWWPAAIIIDYVDETDFRRPIHIHPEKTGPLAGLWHPLANALESIHGELITDRLVERYHDR